MKRYYRAIARIIVTSFIWAVSLNTGVAGPNLENPVYVDAAKVSCDQYQMMYDAEKKIVYVFAPKDEIGLKATVSPRRGWQWNNPFKNSVANTETKTVSVNTRATSVKLYSSGGEGDFAFSIVKTNILAYVEINPYLGMDMTNAGDAKDFKGDGKMHSARVCVVPGSGFEIDGDGSYEWTMSKHVIVSPDTQHNQTVCFSLGKSPSGVEGQEKAIVHVAGRLNGKKISLSGNASFTIVQVDVCANNVGEAKEDDPGVVLQEGAVSASRTVKFTCKPAILSARAQRLMISCPNASTLLEANPKGKNDALGPYIAARLDNLAVKDLPNKKFYLNTKAPQSGEIRIEHVASGAKDVARYVCWGFDFIKPSGSPITEPHDSGDNQNEFCYDDDAKACRVELVIGVVPRDFSLTKAQRNALKAAYEKGSFDVTAINEEGVKLEWDPAFNGQKGKWSETGTLQCKACAIYKGMPERSNSFGRKFARFTGGAYALSAQFELFFNKKGHGHPTCKKVSCADCPNWFYYWRQGAVPGLNEQEVTYQDLGDERLGQAQSAVNEYWIEISDLASEEESKAEYTIQKFEKFGVPNSVGLYTGDKLHMVPNSDITVGLNACGIALAAAVVKHEGKHIEVYKASSGKADMDRDQVADDCEGNYGFDTYVNMNASYNFLDKNAKFSSVYADYVDDEIRARLAERSIQAGKDYIVSKDWAKPGCQSIEAFGPRQ